MDQFVLALLLGGFFSIIVLFLQNIFEVYNQINDKVEPVDDATYDYEANLPYSSRVFRDPKNQPWMFTDAIMGNIINYFRSELTTYTGSFSREESIELSNILYDKTHLIESFFRETKRGKLNNELFQQITTAEFESSNEEKQFLLCSVFKEAHNGLIDDLFAGKLNVRK